VGWSLPAHSLPDPPRPLTTLVAFKVSTVMMTLELAKTLQQDLLRDARGPAKAK